MPRAPYCDQVAAWVGLEIPMVNMVHQYLVTESLPQIEALEDELPVVRDPYSDSYLRQEGNGLLIGPYETEGARLCFEDGVPWSFDQELFEPEVDRLMPWLERCTERLPLFGEAGIKRVVSGPITHLPDGGFLLGPAPGLTNHWMACGSSIGISQGGGAGKYLAQWMVHGHAEINMNPFDPRRFGSWSCGSYARAKGIEEYQHMYSPVLPGESRPAGRPQRTTPLFERSRDKGTQFVEVFGWERPTWTSRTGETEDFGFRRNNSFEAVGEECRTVRERVGVMDMSSFAKFMVTGACSAAHLERIFANRMPREDGGIALAHFLDDRGRILGEATVTRMASDRHYVLTGAGSELRDLDNLRYGLGDLAVEITSVSDELGMLVLAGPHACDVLGKLTDTHLDNSAFRWLSGKRIEVAGIDLMALRVNYVGELGWELHAPMQDLARLYDALMEAGDAYGIGDFGAYAMNSLRLEKAYRGYGAELTNEVTMREASMERFVATGKDFRGKDATMAEPRLRLVQVAVDAVDADCLGNEPVFSDDRLVGVTTSGGFGHWVKKSLAFAYTEPGLAAAGTELAVEILGERRRAVILAEPVWDPENARLRG